VIIRISQRIKPMNGSVVLAAAAFLLATPALAAEIVTPVSFNVAVSVSSLTPDVEAVAVKCAIKTNDGAKWATGEGTSPVNGGAFDGVVTVPIGGSYSTQSLAGLARPSWECDLFLVSKNGSELFAGASDNPVWAQAAANSQPANAIGGKFPPDPSDTHAIDPLTGR
jgi:hypothetical protein